MFVVMQQKEPGEYRYVDTDDQGQCREYATRAEAEQAAESLGGQANGYTAESLEDAATLYQHGARWKVQHS